MNERGLESMHLRVPNTLKPGELTRSQRFDFLARLATIAVLLMSCAVLLGWLLNIPFLKSIVPGFGSMKFNAALSFVAAGVALWLIWSKRQPTLQYICITFVILISLLTICEYLLGVDLLLDQLIVSDSESDTSLPGRMAPSTATNFLLVGIALVSRTTNRLTKLRQAASLFVLLNASLALIGYLYGIEVFYRTFSTSTIALHTAIAFVLLSAAMLFSDRAGWMNILQSDSEGGVIVRTLLPSAIILPIIIHFLQLQGQNAGLLDTTLGTALAALASVILIAIMIWRSAYSAHQIDQQRRLAEAELIKSKEELELRVQERTAKLSAANVALQAEIAERQQIETALAHERDLLQGLMDHIPDMIYFKDTQSRFTRINKAEADLLGVSTPEDALNKTDADFQAPQLAKEFLDEEKRIIESGEPLIDRIEFNPLPDGRPRWFSATKVPVYDAAGRITGLIGISRDITDHKHAEFTLKENEERHRVLFALVRRQAEELALLDLIRTALEREIDLGTAFRRVVEAVRETFDYTHVAIYLWQGDVLRLQHQIGYPQGLQEISIMQGIIGRTVRTGKPVLIEDVRLDAEFIEAAPNVVSEICVPLFDETDVAGVLNIESTNNTKLTEADLQLMIAVSKQINVVLERTQLYARMGESEQRYRELFEGINDAIFLHDEEANILDVNEETCRYLGYTRAELLGMKTTAIDGPQYAAGFKGRWERQITDGKLNHIKGIHIAKDGRHVLIDVSSTAIDYKGKQAVLSVVRDITEQKQLEEQQLALNLEREKVKVLAGFIRDASHDFKTPLTVINTSVHLLRRITDPELREQRMDTIERQVERIDRLLDGLLTMTELDNTISVSGGKSDINHILQMIFTHISAQFDDKTLYMDFQLQEPLVHVPGNETQIHRALKNIVDNAVQYTPEGGTITLKTEQQAEAVVIEVSDTGVGISDDDLPHVFERFYRADKARSMQTGGIGLGLAIAQKIIHSHGGSIEVESALGKGSLFRISLPASVDHPTHTATIKV